MTSWIIIFKKIFVIIIIFYFSITNASLFYQNITHDMLSDARTKINILQKDIYNQATKNSILNLANQNDKLHQEIIKLRGHIELLINKLDNIQHDKKKSDMIFNNRLNQLEQRKS